MADIPTPRSYPQILGDMEDAFLSDQRLQNLRVGSPILSLLEAAAQSDMRSSQDIFDLLNSISLDKATGLALIRIGEEEGVPKESEAPSTGKVDITDTSFTKLSTKLFQGRPAPIIGSFTLAVADAALWPASGQVYIGRGTSNYEGPLTWSAKANLGTYWELTLTQPTTKLHNVGETVILAQGGNRVIGEATIVKTPQANVSDAIEFRTLYSATIPDGETSVTGVDVVCEKPGIIGRVPARAISQFATLPFAGATVTNPLPFSNGRETEDDDSYRERIRNARRTRTKGTALAIKTAVTGIGSVDESKRVTSAQLVVRTGYPTTLYIDDGTGYEERSSGVAVEILVDSALGGEQYFQAKRRPIAKAFLLSRNAAPYLLTSGAELKVRVGATIYTHRFDAADFAAIESASAYEIVSSINGNETLGFFARTSDSGARVILFAKDETNEDLEVVGGDVSEVFRFPSGTAYSLQLYKNDRLLVKDGRTAVFTSNLFGAWDSISGSQTLEVGIDDTPAITYTFVDQDFIDAQTGFTAVGKNTVAAWVAVINRKIPGVTATESDGRIVLTSNAGVRTTAAIEISDGSLVAVRMFGTGIVLGQARDYTVDRNTAQIRLERTLVAGDRLSIGSAFTRSFVESATIPATTTVADAETWFSVDGDATRVALGLSGANPVTITIAGIHDWGHLLKISTTVPAFLHVREGDWMVGYDPNLDTSLFGNFRVAEVERDEDGEVVGTWITVERRTAVMARTGHRTVTLDPVGADIAKVLTTGGATRAYESDIGLNSTVEGVTAACEVYDPNTGLSTPVASMTRARAYHTATLLADGRVLVTGGVSANGEYLDSTEIYDPIANSWTGGPDLPEAVSHHAATLLATGDVYIAGGFQGVDISSNIVVSGLSARFNVGPDTMTAVSALNDPRADHRMVTLADGRVLIAGGLDSTGVLTSVEIYNNAGPALANVAPMTVARRAFGISIESGVPVVVGNFRGLENTSTYETYDVGTDTWTLDQLSATKYVFCESHDVLPVAGTDHYAMNCWYETAAGVKTPVVMQWDGATWTEVAANPLNTDSYAYREKQWVEVHSSDLSTQGKLIGVGGLSVDSNTVAQVEWFSTNSSPAWPTSVIEPAVTSSTITLSSPPGLVFVRSPEPLQHLTLDPGANYTATSLASFLNANLVGAAASVYKTNRLRVATNSFGMEGDIALVAANQVGLDAFKIAVGDAVDNLVGHMASVESGNSEAGTPTFEEIEVEGLAEQTDADFWGAAILSVPNLGGGHQLVGLRNNWAGAPATYHRRFGSNLNARLRSGFVAAGTAAEDATRADIRNVPPAGDLFPHERFYAGAPFAIGPQDDLVVQVDNDLNKRYAVNMWRKLKPATNVYGLTNTFKDADAGNVSLATTFGLDYPFDDFTVYMKARAVAFDGDANRRLLFRFHQVGPDGEFSKVRFSNPDEAAASTVIAVDNQDVESTIRIKLPSGAARTPSLRSTTRLAYACTSQTGSVGTLVFAVGYPTTQAQRTDGTDELRLRIQLPPAVTTCGLVAGNVIYLQSINGGFSSDSYTVTSVAAASGPGGTQDVFVTDLTAGDLTVGASIGTISLDAQGECLFSGAGIVIGDYSRIEDTTALGSFWTESTYRITAVAAQYLICTSGERAFNEFFVDPIMANSALNAADGIKIFASAPPTVNALAATINAAAALENAVCPITVAVLGTGTGTVDRSTPEELSTQDWYELADGVNWVSKTDSPPTVAGDYDLSFKKDVTGTLSVNADWVNEEVRICPTSAANVVKWFNTPAVSGLYSSCIVQASSDGAKVQFASRIPGTAGAVHVQGGLANAAVAPIKGDALNLFGKGVSTILRSLSAGFTSGSWVAIENNLAVPKIGIITNSTTLQSWTADGMVTLNDGVFTPWLDPTNGKFAFEKQGDYVAVSVPGLDALRFKVKSVQRDSVSTLHTMVLLIPEGLSATGWQAGDSIVVDYSVEREIVRAESVLAGNYFFDLKLKDGETALDYITGDIFQVTSTHADFPAGDYEVVGQVAQPTGAVRVECTHSITAPVANTTLVYSIGKASRTDVDFNSDQVDLLSVGAYDSINKTVTVTFETSAPTDVTRDWLGYSSKVVDWGSVEEGDLLSIEATASATPGWTDKQVPVQNQGIFRVVRIARNADVPNRAGTVWIENPDAVEGTFEARVAAYDYHSIMPGDLLVVNTALWGAENRGTWVVEKTGVETAASTAQFVSPNKFKVSLATRTPRSVGNPGALGAQSALVQIIESRPARLVKRIDGISPNQNDGSYVDVRWDNSWHLQQISAQAGSVVKSLDKMAFPTDLAGGADGYAYNTGLIGEANKIVYGDPSDTSAYPGVAAAGAQININGPLVKRLKLALQLRVRTGASTNDIADRVRSAVATAVNQIGVGQPVALSAIIAAASKVVGVVSVTVVSPAFNAENDLISVQPFEKPLIVNLNQDISITFAGE